MLNVWVALAYEGHQHHESATAWFAKLNEETVYFCRFIQLGLLRLLTHPSACGKMSGIGLKCGKSTIYFFGTNVCHFAPRLIPSRWSPAPEADRQQPIPLATMAGCISRCFCSRSRTNTSHLRPRITPDGCRQNCAPPLAANASSPNPTPEPESPAWVYSSV
jgi:hypothetical protein